MPATHFTKVSVESASMPVKKPCMTSEEIVISGIAGRFPEARDISQFAQTLFNNTELQLPTNRMHTQRPRTVTFDSQLFNISQERLRTMTVPMKYLVEQTYDAIVDSGILPTDLKNTTRTGLFIATCCESINKTSCNLDNYCELLSTVFQLNGVTQVFKNQFGSSFIALDKARRSILNGECDQALVCAIDMINEEPTVVSVFIQRENLCKHTYYMRLKESMIYQDHQKNAETLKDLYKEWNIDSTLVTYVENFSQQKQSAEEYKVLSNLYAPVNVERALPVLIGSMMPRSFVCSTGIEALVKMIVGVENGLIPSSEVYGEKYELNRDVKPVETNTKFYGGLVALNLYERNGMRVHMVMQPNMDYLNKIVKPTNLIQETKTMTVPRLFNFSAGTQEGLDRLIKEIRLNPLTTLNQLTTPLTTDKFRGYCILNVNNQIQEINQLTIERPTPVYYLFNGLNVDWFNNWEQLMEIVQFRESIERANEILLPYGFNLLNVLREKTIDRKLTLNMLVCITAFQMAIVDVLRTLNVEYQGLIGYSIGELACAYADRALTFEQTIKCAYFRGKCIEEARLPTGAMATIGLSWEECQKRLPVGVVLACNNHATSVTVSGPLVTIQTFVTALTKQGINALILNTNQIAYHSQYISPVAPALKKTLETIIEKPIKRTNKWISTSFAENRWTSELSQFASADYFTNNICSHVLLKEALKFVPVNAVVIEIGPMAIMQTMLQKAMPLINIVPLTISGEQQLINFWTQLGRMFIHGVWMDLVKIQTTTNNNTKCTYKTKANELKERLEKMYLNKCVDTKCVESTLISTEGTQYMQMYQQEKLTLLGVQMPEFLTIKQKTIVEELEKLIRLTPTKVELAVEQLERQLDLIDTLVELNGRQSPLQVRLIQDLQYIIREQIRYFKHREIKEVRPELFKKELEQIYLTAFPEEKSSICEQKRCVDSQQCKQTGECTKFQMRYTVDLSNEDRELLGHKIQGRYVYPASGFIYLVWKSFAKFNGIATIEECPIQFTNIRFLNQVTFNRWDKLNVVVEINRLTGLFNLYESEKLICTGCVEFLSKLRQWSGCDMEKKNQTIDMERCRNVETINQREIYQCLQQRGYDLEGEFQPIVKANTEGTWGELTWSGKWIAFLDGMIQMSLLAKKNEGSCLPTLIKMLVIDPTMIGKEPCVNTPVMDNKVDLASLFKNMDPSVMMKYMKSSMLNNVDPSLLLKYMPTMINNVEPSVIAKFMNPTMWNNVDSADITADMFVGKTYATMTRSERIQWMKTTAKSTLDILLTLRNYIRLHGENMVEGAQTMFDMTLAGMAIFKNQHHIVGENMTDDEINVFSSLLHDSLDTVQGVMVLLFPNGIQHFNLTKNIKTTGRLETEMNMVEEKLQTLLKSGPLFTARTTFNTLGQQLKQTPTTVPVWYNAQTGQIRCRGVEITGLQLAPVVSVIPTVTVNKSVEERDFIDTYRSLRQPINNKVNFSPLQTYMNSSLDHHERQLIEDTLTSITSRKVNYLMPQTCIEPLNQVEIYSQMGEHKPTPVFMIHPIEGHCNTLRNMAKFIRAPVYGIQYTREAMNIETFEELANFYWTKIQQQCGVNTRVNLCGMGFGGIVALEMSMRRPTWCVSLTVLDDNMLPMKDNNWQVDALMRFATQYYQTMNKTEFYNQLIEFRTMEQRIKFVVRELMQKSQIHFDMLDLEEAVRAYVMKYTMMCQYVPLIQLRIPSVYFVRCGLRQPLVQIKTYLQRLVEQCFTGKVETELVDCDVRSFLEGNNGYQVATIMNENLLRQF